MLAQARQPKVVRNLVRPSRLPATIVLRTARMTQVPSTTSSGPNRPPPNAAISAGSTNSVAMLSQSLGIIAQSPLRHLAVLLVVDRLVVAVAAPMIAAGGLVVAAAVAAALVEAGEPGLVAGRVVPGDDAVLPPLTVLYPTWSRMLALGLVETIHQSLHEASPAGR